MRVLLAAFALLAAGCAAPEAAVTPASVAPPLASEATLMPCVEHAADVPVDAADAQRRLPAGLKPRPLAPGGPPLLEVVAVECGEGETPQRAVFAWMLVDPPAELQATGVAGYLFVFAAVTDDPALVDALAAAGVPATLGEVSLSASETPGSVAGKATATAAEWSLSLATTVPKRQLERAHPIFRALVADETGVTHAVDVDGGRHPHHDPGAATLAFTGDAPFPAPRGPGLGVHGMQGHLGFRLVTPENMTEPPAGA